MRYNWNREAVIQVRVVSESDPICQSSCIRNDYESGPVVRVVLKVFCPFVGVDCATTQYSSTDAPTDPLRNSSLSSRLVRHAHAFVQHRWWEEVSGFSLWSIVASLYFLYL